mgnify:FL=1
MPADQLTKAQEGYILHLLGKLDLTFEELWTELDDIDAEEIGDLTKAEASKVIEYLKEQAGE